MIFDTPTYRAERRARLIALLSTPRERFAWLPCKLDDGRWVWLEWVRTWYDERSLAAHDTDMLTWATYHCQLRSPE